MPYFVALLRVPSAEVTRGLNQCFVGIFVGRERVQEAVAVFIAQNDTPVAIQSWLRFGGQIRAPVSHRRSRSWTLPKRRRPAQ